jgi:hypothetical protein
MHPEADVDEGKEAAHQEMAAAEKGTEEAIRLVPLFRNEETLPGKDCEGEAA